jgi:hypothetical protein
MSANLPRRSRALTLRKDLADMDSGPETKLSAMAATISRYKKERLLLSMSEEEFRDQVVRPLYYRLGFRDGRDVCGADEEGKDAIFTAPDPFGDEDIYVIQTKKGNLNLSSTVRDNVATALTQLRTASETSIPLPAKKTKRLPSKVILCVSGRMNLAARKHIVDEVRQATLKFQDSDELIPLIDQHYPELWLAIGANLLPYIRAIRRAIEVSNENVAIAELIPGMKAAATDDMFVEIFLWRNTLKARQGSTKADVPSIIEIPAIGILSKPERLILILGEAGAGKSTAIRRIAYVLAGRALASEKEPVIPVLLRAIDLASLTAGSLLERAILETKRTAESGAAAFVSADIESGRVVVLVDALDEVATHSDRASVLKRINEFHSLYPQCLIVLTSREYAYVDNTEALDAFTKYRVAEFSHAQAQQLLQRLERRGSLPREASNELVRRLEDIHGMDLNPLLVTLFAATNDAARQDIPANITELFKKFTEMLLGRWDATKGFSQQFHAPLKDFVLQKIAFEMHIAGVTSLSAEEFKERVTVDLANRGYETDVEMLIDEIVNRSGLVREVGGRVEFRHLLVQEFFAGRGIPNSDRLETLIFEDWWRRAVVFYFGERPGNGEALARLRAVVGTRTTRERFTGACTLGLALQACYLVPLVDKVAGISDIIEHLAQVKDGVLAQPTGEARAPLFRFVSYYLQGRDSVALSALETTASDIESSWPASDPLNEARKFWLIIGLLEAGKVTKAEVLIRGFRPRDKRLLLAIHLGCYLIEQLRLAPRDQKRSAKRICDKLESRILPLRKQVIEELKTELLEVRQGEVKALGTQ